MLSVFNIKIIFILFFIVIYSLGVSVFNFNRKSTLNRLFILLLFSASFNNLIQFMLNILQTEWIRNYLIQIGDLTRIILPPLYLHFSIIFTNNKLNKKILIYLIWSIYIFPFLLFIYLPLLNIDLFYKKVNLLVIYQIIFIFGALANILNNYTIENDDHKKRKLLWVFFVFSSNFIIHSIIQFIIIYNPNILSGIIQYFIIHLFLPFLLFLFLTPPLLDFNFADFKLIIKRGGIYSIFIILLLSFYLLIYENIILNSGIESKYGYILDIALILIIFITFQPFQSDIYRVIGSFLMLDWYKIERELVEFSKESVKIIDIELLITLLRKKIKKMFNPQFVHCVIDYENILNNTNPEFYNTLKQNDYIKISNMYKFSKKLPPDTVIVFSIKRANIVLGYIGLGPKKGEDYYNQEDINIILYLMYNISIAVYNAMLYRELEIINNKLFATLSELNKNEENKKDIYDAITRISHQLKNPLGVIKLSLEEINNTSNDKNILELSNIAIQEINKIQTIINNLLFFNSPFVLNPKKINLLNFFHNLINDLIPTAIYPDINIKIDIPDNIYILFDEERLKEAIVNIIINAIEACEYKGNISINGYTKKNGIYVEIANDGIAISHDKIDKIFKPFYSYKSKGSGLGLYITKRIIEKAGGKIWVKSGKITVFTIYLGGLSEA